MALLVTLFLVLVNIFNAITTNSPKADGLNAIQASIVAQINYEINPFEGGNEHCIVMSIFFIRSKSVVCFPNKIN